LPEIYVADREAWDAWLAEHHETEPEVWTIYWKKATGKPSIRWADAVEVALKYGWIDGLARSIDDERYMQRWTPRRPKSRWSLVNKRTAERLIASGEMTAMGLRAVEAAKASGEWERAYTVRPAPKLPDDLKARIAASPAAKAQRQRLSTTRLERWLAWLDATDGRTRARRLNLIVKALEDKDYAAVDQAAAKERARA
jgi:uncharacterized protein YdeI (YjbR/CyaY-like superfamily)